MSDLMCLVCISCPQTIKKIYWSIYVLSKWHIYLQLFLEKWALKVFLDLNSFPQVMQGNERPSIWISAWSLAWNLFFVRALSQILQHQYPKEFLPKFSKSFLSMSLRSLVFIGSTLFSIWVELSSGAMSGCSGFIFLVLEWGMNISSSFSSTASSSPPSNPLSLNLWATFMNLSRCFW